LRIKHKLYMVSMFGPDYNEDIDYIDNNSENTVIQYLSIVFKFFNGQGLGNDGDIKMLHALEVIEKVTFKLKWNMRREVFLKSEIFKNLLAFFDDYSMRCYPLP